MKINPKNIFRENQKKMANIHVFELLNLFSIRNRLILIFLLVSIGPIILMGFISYNFSKSAITSKVSNYSKRELTQTIGNLNLVLKKYEDFSLQFIANMDTQTLLDKINTGNSDLEKLQNTSKLQNYFQSAFALDSDLTVAFYPVTKEEVIYCGF